MFINKVLIKFAKGSFKQIRHSIYFQILITIIASFTTICTGLLINNLIKHIKQNEGIFVNKDSWVISCVIITCLILSKSLSNTKVKIVTKSGISIKDNIRAKLFQKLFLLGPSYLDKERTGFLTSTFTTRVEWLMNYYTKYMPVAISAIVNAILFTVFLIYVDIYTGFVAALSVLMMLFIPMSFFKIMREKGKKEWEWHAKYYSECLDGIQGMTNLKAFNADEKYVEDIKEYGQKYRKSVMEHLGVTIIEGSFLEFFVRTGTALTIVILAWRAMLGKVDRSLLVIALFSVGAMFSPMLTLISAWHMGFQGVSGSYSIQEFLEIITSNTLTNPIVSMEFNGRRELEQRLKRYERKSFHSQKAEVEFKNVSFRYEGEDRFAAENINLKISSGKTIALVGVSGGGKSTVAGLLAGFYPCCKGSIKMNGNTLNNDNLEYFQNNISAVWQSNHMFSGNIYDNIRMGYWQADKEKVYEAAKKARIHELIISLPHGYNTAVNELGGIFSVGERQRIAIARALLKDAFILILDEATSSLDRENETYIQKTLEDLKGEKGILVIAHRLETIEKADEICFLKDGKIINRGTHKELLQKSPEYRKLVKGAV